MTTKEFFEDKKTSLIGKAILVSQRSNKNEVRAKVCGLSDDEHCLRFGDGKISWLKIIQDDGNFIDGYRLAADMYQHTSVACSCLHKKDNLYCEDLPSSDPLIAITPARLNNNGDNIQCNVNRQIIDSSQYSLPLGSGSVSKVRSGFLIKPQDSETMKLGSTHNAVHGLHEGVIKEPIAIKFFKTSQEIWDHLSPQDKAEYSLYPEVRTDGGILRTPSSTHC